MEDIAATPTSLLRYILSTNNCGQSNFKFLQPEAIILLSFTRVDLWSFLEEWGSTISVENAEFATIV